MLGKSGFDQWSESYDDDIEDEKERGYPFAGYFQTLSLIQGWILNARTDGKILDIGIGTGLLTELLYQNGFDITGMDFSLKMLEQAREKMPRARLINADMQDGLTQLEDGEMFDFVISTYVLHHIPNEEKVTLISGMAEKLASGGMILIGDIAFRDAAHREAVRSDSSGWDESEFYFAADELIEALSDLSLKADFNQTSICSGALRIQVE